LLTSVVSCWWRLLLRLSAIKQSRIMNPPIAELKSMSDADIFWTFQTAASYGGSFFRALADAGLAADPGNKRRILMAFPEMTATYGPASPLHRRLRDGEAA
jgi:hypothetical protein